MRTEYCTFWNFIAFWWKKSGITKSAQWAETRKKVQFGMPHFLLHFLNALKTLPSEQISLKNGFFSLYLTLLVKIIICTNYQCYFTSIFSPLCSSPGLKILKLSNDIAPVLKTCIYDIWTCKKNLGLIFISCEEL